MTTQAPGAAAQIEFTGTSSQIEWATLIRPRVDAEFERVARVLTEVASHQTLARRKDTEAILAILEEKRQEVLAHTEAGYYIRHWQELGGQVRALLAKDPRFQTIEAHRNGPKFPTRGTPNGI